MVEHWYSNLITCKGFFHLQYPPEMPVTMTPVLHGIEKVAVLKGKETSSYYRYNNCLYSLKSLLIDSSVSCIVERYCKAGKSLDTKAAHRSFDRSVNTTKRVRNIGFFPLYLVEAAG